MAKGKDLQTFYRQRINGKEGTLTFRYSLDSIAVDFSQREEMELSLLALANNNNE